MSNRPSLGFNDDEAPAPAAAPVLDLSEFKPKSVARPDKEVLEKAAEKANFKSREPKAVLIEQPSVEPVKPSRRRRTGRSAQLNLKVRPDTIAAFYAIADAQGWVLGEVFEKAVDLLTKDIEKKAKDH